MHGPVWWNCARKRASKRSTLGPCPIQRVPSVSQTYSFAFLGMCGWNSTMPSSVDMSGRSFLGARRIRFSGEGGCHIGLARTIWDYLYIRKLRNRVRLHMTNHTAKVSLLGQLRFYLNKPANV